MTAAVRYIVLRFDGPRFGVGCYSYDWEGRPLFDVIASDLVSAPAALLMIYNLEKRNGGA